MNDIIAGKYPNQFDSKSLQSYQDLAKTKTFQTGLKFLEFFEQQFKCSGICKTALFYWTRPLSDGIPKNTCLLYLKEQIKDNLTYLGIVSVVAGIMSLFAFLVQYCLWRKFD
jgi:hypothetical protein